MPQLEYVLKGFKRKAPNSARRRLQITLEILKKLRQVWDQSPQKRDAKMLWAASCLYFYDFLRSGKIGTPTCKDYDQAYHLCVERRTVPYQRGVCGSSQKSSGRGRHSTKGLFGPQLPNRSGNHSSQIIPPRLTDKDTRTVGKLNTLLYIRTHPSTLCKVAKSLISATAP